jgi:hypothetical protein
MKRNLVLLAPLSLALLSAGTAPTFAGSRALTRADVTACSRYSNGCYTAARISNRDGDQLVLRHGTRIGCEGDCKNRLRETTVDFWDTMRENGS